MSSSWTSGCWRILPNTPTTISRTRLDDLLPQKLIPVVIELSGIPGRQKVHDLTREQRQSLLRVLKHFPVEVSAPCPVTDAIVTSGGVKVGEVDPKPWSPSLLKESVLRGRTAGYGRLYRRL